MPGMAGLAGDRWRLLRAVIFLIFQSEGYNGVASGKIKFHQIDDVIKKHGNISHKLSITLNIMFSLTTSHIS